VASADLLAERFDIPAALAHRAAPWLNLAKSLSEANRLAESMLAVERALALDPRSLPAKSLRKSLTALIDAAEPALMKLDLNAAVHFDQATSQMELAFAYAARDRLHDAERQFQSALRLAPSLAEARGGLAALYLRAGLPDKAREAALATVALEPSQALACQTLSTLAERDGDADAAARWLDKAYEARSLFHEPATDARADVLVLATRSQGNIPYRYLMPPPLYTRHVWYMEHATVDQDLPPYDVVFNAIGDPDLSAPSQAAVTHFLAHNRRPLINRPEPVQRTFRDAIPDLLGYIDGVVAPQTVRTTADRIGETGLDLPVLVRPMGSHGGVGLRRAETAKDVAQIAARLAGQDVYVTKYIAYEHADSYYRKGRMIFIDRQPLPYHWAISQHWMVHYVSSDMAEGGWRRAEEESYLYDTQVFLGDTATHAIAEIGRRLDLDYCGLDFSLLPDGRVLVFEANATMLVHPEDEDSPFAYRNRAVTRITSAFQAMLEKRAAL
jgi:tetratricopeptide (TPR) repeat protein